MEEQMRKLSIKTQQMHKMFDIEKNYNIDDAIEILRKFQSIRKFSQGVELIVKLKDSKVNKFVFNLVYGLPQNLKILAIVNSTLEKKLKEENTFPNLHIGGEEMLEPIIRTGKTDFNNILCTTDMFAKITKHAKALGQLRLMPSSKTGTVLDDVMGGVRSLLLGTIAKVKKDVNTVRLKIAGVAFENSHIKENIIAVLEGIKTELGGNDSIIESVSIKLSMSPAVKLVNKL